jgi:KipI family sensor histidine kinase inhibitor
LPFGDCALLIELGDTISLEINRKVIALNEAIAQAKILGTKETVPTYRSILIRYDPLETTYDQLVFHVRDLEQKLEMPSSQMVAGKAVIIPVVYGGEYGPDLSFVAQYHGLTEEQVVKLHSDRAYRVYMLGFVAGFPYLGEVAEEIATPRLETPRLRVPIGSVGIAEKQTGIYPCEVPGGWRIIGRTPLKLFNAHRQPPAFLKPGQTVKFKPIPEDEYQALSKEQKQ